MNSKRLIEQTMLCVLCCLLCRHAALGDTEGPLVLPPPGSQPVNPQIDSGTAELLAPPLSDSSSTEGLLEQSLSEMVPAQRTDLEELPGWWQPAYWFGPAPWDVGVEFGLNGSEGVNESLSLRSGGHLKRKTKHWKFDTSLAYNKNSANDVETQNNGLLDVRIDRRMKDSPWSIYFLHQTLYDEFQAYDLRVSANAGVGRRLIDTKRVDFMGRFGAGTSREFGGVDEEWAPEALFGLEYEHEFSDSQRFSAKADYFPEWDQFNHYRVVADMGWEIDLDRPKNLSLKFSVVDRYDSTPDGVHPNELNYSALLIWGL